jgi:hypothetical protein
MRALLSTISSGWVKELLFVKSYDKSLQQFVSNVFSMSPPSRRTAPFSEDEALDSTTVAIFVACCVGLVIMAGLMSGLTLGLMSLDNEQLQVGGHPREGEGPSIPLPMLQVW